MSQRFSLLLALSLLTGASRLVAQDFYMGAGYVGATNRTTTDPGGGGEPTEGAGPNGGDGEGGEEGEGGGACLTLCDCIAWILKNFFGGGMSADGAHYQSVPTPTPPGSGEEECVALCISIKSGGDGGESFGDCVLPLPGGSNGADEPTVAGTGLDDDPGD